MKGAAAGFVGLSGADMVGHVLAKQAFFLLVPPLQEYDNSLENRFDSRNEDSRQHLPKYPLHNSNTTSSSRLSFLQFTPL